MSHDQDDAPVPPGSNRPPSGAVRPATPPASETLPPLGPSVRVGRATPDRAQSARAQQHWWDSDSQAYLDEHREHLHDAGLSWGPDGLFEEQAGALGPVDGRDVLEIGAGAGQGTRWVLDHGGRGVATDVSHGMLRGCAAIDAELGRGPTPVVQCDAALLPFADDSFDIVFTSYGAFPFIADGAALVAECARVLRPGGRLAFSVTHPIRWAFPDVPDEAGLTADRSYFDRRAYVEYDERDQPTYVEHHATLGDRIRHLAAAGFVLRDLIEPEWPEDREIEWGGWSPTRGRILPGTALFVADLVTDA